MHVESVLNLKIGEINYS